MPPKSAKSGTNLKEKQQIWFQNLLLLDFPVDEMEKKHGFILNECIFDKPHKTAFEVISQFLFCKWDVEKSTELFKYCYPTFNKQRSQQFRTVCLNLWRRITEENPNFNIPRMTTTLLMSPCGPEVHKFLASFSTYVLFTSARRLDAKGEENTLLPPIQMLKSKSLVLDQARCLKSACHSESLACIHNMQVSRHADRQAKELADIMVQDYRELTRRKKHLSEANKENEKKLNKKLVSGTPSKGDRSCPSPMKPTKMDQQTKTAVTRLVKMWEDVFDAVETTNDHREVLGSVLRNDEEHNVLSASALSPKVPSTLLRQCTSEVYERVGASLYEGGRLNLVSLISLFNLSLHLTIEKLHEVGVPNFETQIPYINVQRQIHSKNVMTLKDMCRDLRQSLPESRRTVQHLKHLVDDRHKQQELQREGAATSLSLPKPLLSSTATTNIHSEKLGLLPPTPPLRFTQNGASSSPYLKHCRSPPKHIPASIVADFATPCIDSQDEIVTACSQLSLDTQEDKPVVRQGTALQLTTDHRIVVKRALRQKQKSAFKHDSTPEKLQKESLAFRSPVMRHLKSSQKSSSVPSTPVAERNDIKMEKVTSRTPEAMRKLIDQIVNYTMEEMEPSPWYIPSTSSPPAVVEPVGSPNLLTQLDPDVFAPGDKISRTPPVIPPHTPTPAKENLDPNMGRSEEHVSPVSSSLGDTESESSRTISSEASENKTFLPDVMLITESQQPSSPAIVVDPFSTGQELGGAEGFDGVLPRFSPNNTHDFAVPNSRMKDVIRCEPPVSLPPHLTQSVSDTLLEMEADFSKYPSLMDMSLPNTPDIFPTTPVKPEKDESPYVPVGNLIEL